MKNVKCLKLNICRENAPEKVGTLASITNFGSFSFPTSGQFRGGLIAQSLAGVGKSLNKTGDQMRILSGKATGVAGKTGVSVDDLNSISLSDSSQSAASEDHTAYSVEFVKLSYEAALKPTLQKINTPAKYALKKGFALKQLGTREQVRFSAVQKNIMTQFYDRQLTSKIKANPKDVIAVMKANDIPPLSEKQIKSWWSTYHQKRKKQSELLSQEAEALSQLNETNTTLSASDAHLPGPSGTLPPGPSGTLSPGPSGTLTPVPSDTLSPGPAATHLPGSVVTHPPGPSRKRAMYEDPPGPSRKRTMHEHPSGPSRL